MQNIEKNILVKNNFCTDNKFLASLFAHLRMTPLQQARACKPITRENKSSLREIKRRHAECIVSELEKLMASGWCRL